MKRWKANSDAEDEKEGEDKERKDDAVPREQAAGPSSTQSAKQPRQRVTAKGTNVPRPAETFETVRDRYNVPSLLLSNLTQNGYLEPTGIQSHGLPILLEVCSCYLPSQSRYSPNTTMDILMIVPRPRCDISNRYRQNPVLPPAHLRKPWIPEW